MRGEPTPAWDFGNSTFWEKSTDIAFVVANSLILLITSSVGIAANLFVILAVYHQKSLQTANNALVVNLAVIDALRCVIDCPILLIIVMTVYQRGHMDELICDTQVVSFSFSCCIQLLTLACISAERYQAIAQPFKTSQRRRRIMVLIPLTWAVAILVAVFCLIFVSDSPVHVRCKGLLEETSFSYDTFGLYMLFPLWAACFSVIIGFYARIFIIVREHNRKIFDKGTFRHSKTNNKEAKQENGETEAVGNEQGISEQDQTLKSVESEKIDLKSEQPLTPAMQVALQTEEKHFKREQSASCGTKVEAKPSNVDAAASVKGSTTKPQKMSSTGKQCKDGVKTDKVLSERRETSSHGPSSAQLANPESTSVLLIEVKQAKSSNRGETLAVATAAQVSSLPPVSNIVPETEATNPKVETEGAVCMMPTKASKERASKKRESKMAKRAGYIIITFILFWLPLITTILMNFVVQRNKNIPITLIRDMEILAVSVACITSLSDPIIYAAVNPQFRTEFYRLKNKFVSIFNKK